MTADSDGHAVFDLGRSPDAEHEIDATATDVRPATRSNQTFHITIDTTWSDRTDDPRRRSGVFLSTQRPLFAVTADPRQDLSLTIDGVPAGLATTDDDGQASISLADDMVLAEGAHTAIVYADDPLGNESASSAGDVHRRPQRHAAPAACRRRPVAGTAGSHTPLTLAMAISGVRLRGSVLSTCAPPRAPLQGEDGEPVAVRQPGRERHADTDPQDPRRHEASSGR